MTRRTPDQDDAFAARLRAAYDQVPAHAAPVLPNAARASAARRRRSARRWVGIGAVVATAAVVPLTANVVLDRQADSPPATTQTDDRGAERRVEAVPRCDLSDGSLDISIGPEQRFRGAAALVRISTTAADCRLDAPVRVTSRVADDRRGMAALPSEPARVIGPGADLAFLVSSPPCNIDVAGVAATVEVTVGDGPTATAELGDLAVCLPLVVGPVFHALDAPTSISGRVSFPPSGADQFSVLWTNEGDEPASLGACPRVEVWSAARARLEQGSFGVPCDPDEVLDPGQQVSVEFRDREATTIDGIVTIGEEEYVGLVGVRSSLKSPAEARRLVSDSAQDASPSGGRLPSCRPMELQVDVGDDLRLPGDRSGRVVRLSTTRDRTCEIAGPVRVAAAVGLPRNGSPPERASADVPADGPLTVAPGRDVSFLVSAETCSDVGRPFEGAPAGAITRFRVATERVSAEVADDLGTTGTCGGLAIGERGRIVATLRNPTGRSQGISPCAFRALPGQGLEIAGSGECTQPVRVIEAGGSIRLTITQQPMGGSLAGRSFAFTVDGVAAPVEVVTVRSQE